MDEDKQVQEQAVESEEVETSEVESPTTETEQTPVEEPTEEEQPVEETASDEESAPEGYNEEQAKAFQKQRQEIKRLQEELAARDNTESALTQLSKTPPGAMQDPVTQQRIMQFELEKTKTLMRYPELDPDSDQYDRELEKEFAKEWAFSQLVGTGKGLLDAAKLVTTKKDRKLNKAVKSATEKTAQEVKESITLKERSSAAAPTKPGGARTTSSDLESLRVQTRLGSKDAFAARLAKAEGRS